MAMPIEHFTKTHLYKVITLNESVNSIKGF